MALPVQLRRLLEPGTVSAPEDTQRSPTCTLNHLCPESLRTLRRTLASKTIQNILSPNHVSVMFACVVFHKPCALCTICISEWTVTERIGKTPQPLTNTANAAFVEFLQRLSRDTIGGIQEVRLCVHTACSMCLHGTHCVTPEEAQAAISPQPLFAPKNQPLQDNEHFKDRNSHNTNESPVKTLCSRQGRRAREGASQLDLSKPHSLSVSGSGRNSSRRLRDNTGGAALHIIFYFLPSARSLHINLSLSVFFFASTLFVSRCEPSYHVSRLFALFYSQSLSRVADGVKY